MTAPLYALDDSPTFEWLRLRACTSVMDFLRRRRPIQPKEITLATADYQTAGRGQAGNSWESAAGNNLLFALLLHPAAIAADAQFILSQITALSLCETLLLHADGFTIKWPNDIYWENSKISGTLIENSLSGRRIDDCLIGVGVNINQTAFCSDAPNPISLRQITGKEHERVFILAEIIRRFKRYYSLLQKGETQSIASAYMNLLYRREGCHLYQDLNGVFSARIEGVEPSGHLLLALPDGQTRRYAFKEVKFLIPED